MNKTFIKRFLFGFFILICALIVGFLVIRYEAEGDKNMPYKLSKILMISTVDGRKNGDGENIWNISLSQVNDLYFYIEKANENTKEVISEVKFDNFSVLYLGEGITQEPKIYRPNGDRNALYLNAVENMLISGIVFRGGTQDNYKETIANTGGVVGFRYALENLGNYISNEAGEVVYNGLLLNKAGIGIDKIKSKLMFEMEIKTNKNIIYRSNTIVIDTPAGDITQEGQSNIEITDFGDVIFKRVSN